MCLQLLIDVKHTVFRMQGYGMFSLLDFYWEEGYNGKRRWTFFKCPI